MRFTLDTNILVYAVDRDAGDRHARALEIVRRSRGRDLVITLQALAELFRALTGARIAMAPARAAEVVRRWRDAAALVAADEVCLEDAMGAVIDHGWSFWDAMMWATAKRHGCRLLITEDGQSGRALGGVTLADPFTDEAHPLIEAALG